MKTKSGVLLDTGPLVAFFDKSDRYHSETVKALSQIEVPLQTCEPVLTEACFLLNKINPACVQDLFELERRGFFQIQFSLKDNLQPIKRVLKKFSDISISLADACLIQMAENLSESRILTLDSDFKIYRWGRNKKFDMLLLI